MKSNASNFLENLYELLSKLSLKIGLSSLRQHGPTFFDNGESVGKTPFGVRCFPLQFFGEKIFFTVVCLLDCKLVRYCNIDVFLLVSHSFCVQVIQI